MRGGTAQGPDRTGMLTARCIGVMFFAGGFPGACLARVDISLGHWGRQSGQGGEGFAQSRAVSAGWLLELWQRGWGDLWSASSDFVCVVSSAACLTAFVPAASRGTAEAPEVSLGNTAEASTGYDEALRERTTDRGGGPCSYHGMVCISEHTSSGLGCIHAKHSSTATDRGGPCSPHGMVCISEQTSSGHKDAVTKPSTIL